MRGRVRIHLGVSGGVAEFWAHRLWRPDAMRPVGLLHTFRSPQRRRCSEEGKILLVTDVDWLRHVALCTGAVDLF